MTDICQDCAYVYELVDDLQSIVYGRYADMCGDSLALANTSVESLINNIDHATEAIWHKARIIGDLIGVDLDDNDVTLDTLIDHINVTLKVASTGINAPAENLLDVKSILEDLQQEKAAREKRDSAHDDLILDVNELAGRGYQDVDTASDYLVERVQTLLRRYAHYLQPFDCDIEAVFDLVETMERRIKALEEQNAT